MRRNPMHRRHVLIGLAIAGSAALVGPFSLAAQSSNDPVNHPAPAKRSNQMSNANERSVTYIAAWNERDTKKRREWVAKTWTDNGV